MSISETKRGSSSSAEVLQALKEKLRFSEWPLREGRLVAGFNPLNRLLLLNDYKVDRKNLLRPIISRVTRKYFLRRAESHVALSVTVIVSRVGARDAAEGLVTQLAASQMGTDPRVDFQAIGDVTIYRQPEEDKSIAFLRNNIGINLESYAPFESSPPIEEVAKQIDTELATEPTTETLINNPRVPRISRFEPKSSVIKIGERTDLEIEIQDNYPPHDLLFEAVNGSYNLDTVEKDLWYFRAGNHQGSAELTLTVVNDLNLMATERRSLTVG